MGTIWDLSPFYLNLFREKLLDDTVYLPRQREKSAGGAHLFHLLGSNTGITPMAPGPPLSEPRRPKRGESDGPLSAQSVV